MFPELLERVPIPLLLASLLFIYLLYMTWIRSYYPPGPWPLPIIGNLHLVSSKIHEDLKNLASKYGPVYTIWLGGRPTVIVCSHKDAMEALQQRGLDFAGRAMDTKAFEMIFHYHEDMASRSLDEKVQCMRKIALAVGRSKAPNGEEIKTIVAREAGKLIRNLKTMGGKAFFPHTKIRLYVSNIMVRLLYDMEFDDEKDPNFLAFSNIGENDSKAFQESALSDFLPILWNLNPSAREAVKRAADNNLEFCNRHYTQHELSFDGTVAHDITDLIIGTRREQRLNSVPKTTALSRLNALLLLLNIQGGGTDTVIHMILWALIAALQRPDLQSRIHMELDSVIEIIQAREAEREDRPRSRGKAVRPVINTSQRDKLPFLNSFMHEVMRICPTVPLALPHKTMRSTKLGKFHIPKSTPVTINIFAIQRDETQWKNPSVFNPDRFLSSDGSFNAVKARELIVFGTGCRSCTGEHLGRTEVFTCLANIFANFEVCSESHSKIPQLGDGHLRLTLSAPYFEVAFRERDSGL